MQEAGKGGEGGREGGRVRRGGGIEGFAGQRRS